jgi:hypothetical protein
MTNFVLDCLMFLDLGEFPLEVGFERLSIFGEVTSTQPKLKTPSSYISVEFYFCIVF